MRQVHKAIPGVIYAGIVATAASYLGAIVPVVGGPVFGIILGAFLGNVVGRPEGAAVGTAFTAKKILQWSIILLGSGLSLRQVIATGSSSFLVMILTLATAFLAALLVGRLLGIPRKLTLLIGAGTGICGGSAIAALSPIIAAEEVDVAYSMSTIFAFNVVAVLLFPLLGRLLGFSQGAFGIWAGTAINDTSSVVAAAYSYGNAAGNVATVVKLTRTTMIVPISILLALVMTVRARRMASARSGDEGTTGGVFAVARIFPWFILGFVAMALANTIHLLPIAVIHLFTAAGKFMIVMALSAIGLNANFRKMLTTGVRPFILGLAVWGAVALSSVAVQKLLM